MNYRKSTFLNETNNNAGSSVNYVGFQNDLYGYGGGFSAQFGAIAKVTNHLRLGITYDSPIWYNIYEETTQYIETSENLTEKFTMNISTLKLLMFLINTD